MYTLSWKQPALDANKAASITVPVGSIVSNKASLRFTGKGAANYGTIQQENLMRLLENFADATAPQYPTVGQEWYDTANSTLRICSSTSPLAWKSLGGVQVTNVGEAAPSPAALGDIWFQRLGSSSGVLYIYTGMGRYPDTGTAIGGWDQVWPTVEIAAGREEYNVVRDLVDQLISMYDGGGGSGALGKVITNLTNFTALDAEHYARFIQRTPGDPNTLTPIWDQADETTLAPTSYDWDTLLAAARYAVNRLELPVGVVDDISPVPFVSDGRQAPLSLTSLSASDIRYPSLERRSNRRFGMVTLIRLFTETLNVLNAAFQNRYSIKGINGASGSNTAFGSNTTVATHVTFAGPMGGNTNSSIALALNFTDETALRSFIQSGGAVQLTLTHVPGGSGNANDTNFKALMDSRGVLRFTADKTRVFANTLPLTLSIPPIATGLKNAPSGGVTLTTQAVAGASYRVDASITNSNTRLNVNVYFFGSGAMNGTLTIKYDIIKDTETYLNPAPTFVYGSPVAYISGDKGGSAFFT